MAEDPPTCLRIAIWGASGRMGQALLATLRDWRGLTLVAAVVSPDSPWLGRELREREPSAPAGVPFVSGRACPPCDAIIEFSGSAGLLDAVASAEAFGAALVSGSTGLEPEARQRLKDLSLRVPVLWSANFSLGAAALAFLAEQAAACLPDFDAELVEIHHRGKRDAPSGTALALAEAIASGKQRLGRQAKSLFPRTGPRAEGEIGIVSLRGGDAVGEHRLFLLGDGERLELAHQASDRRVFARGALRAAAWLVGKPPGLYRLRDVLVAAE